jgi:hypothetical protein
VFLFAAATVPLAVAGATTSYWLISAALFLEGIAAGLVWVPAIGASYGELRIDEISHATTIVSVVTRIGASIGTAAAAIVLQHELASHARTATDLTAAYGITFWAVVCMGALPLVPYLLLLGVRQRSASRVETDLAIPGA